MAGAGETQRARLTSIGLVVARSSPGNVIGRDGRLPWHLRSDLRRFRALTLGSGVVMGRKTYDSIGRPLPGRLNVVVSRSLEHTPPSGPDGPYWTTSLQAALAAADAHASAHGRDEIFVIGGAAVFRHVLEADLVARVYLTTVEAPDIVGDAVFAEHFAAEEWQVVHAEDVAAGSGDEFPSRFEIVERRREVVRYRNDAHLPGTGAGRSAAG